MELFKTVGTFLKDAVVVSETFDEVGAKVESFGGKLVNGVRVITESLSAIDTSLISAVNHMTDHMESLLDPIYSFGEKVAGIVNSMKSSVSLKVQEISHAFNFLAEPIVSVGKKLGSIGTSMFSTAKSIGSAALSIGSSMFSAGEKVAKLAVAVEEAAQKAGTDAETWQKLNYAMSQNGISSGNLEKSMIENQKSLNKAGQGVSANAKAYEQLNVNIQNTDGSLRNSDDVYQDTLKALADIEDVNKRNALANQIFGDSYAALGPILEGGSEGIEALTSRAEQLGLVMSQETIEAGALFANTLSDVKQVGEGLFSMIAAELLPLLQIFLDFFIDHAPMIQEIVGRIVDFIVEAVKGFKIFWEENGAEIEKVIQALFETIGTIVEIGMSIIKGVIDVVMGIISGDWGRVWNGLKDILSGVLDLITEALKLAMQGLIAVITGVAGLLKEAGKKAFEAVWDGMKETWNSIANWVAKRIEELEDTLMFWRKSKSEMDDSKSKNGSHASGLAYVPYDGYIAELHRGERVVNAEDNKTYGSETPASAGNTFVFNAPNPLTPAEARRQMLKAQKELLLGF